MGVKGRPPKSPKLKLICLECSKEWEQYAWQPYKLKYCSIKCRAKAQIGKGVPRVTPEERKCKRCGVSFLVGGVGNKWRGSVYCSRFCATNGRWADNPGHTPAKQMSALDAAWLAGLFDGEGSIVWPRKQNLKTVRLSVKMTSKECLDEIYRIVGTGKIREGSKYLKSPNHSRTWSWDCYGENARIVLRQIYQRLIVKREAAEVALSLRAATAPPLTQRTKQALAAKASGST